MKMALMEGKVFNRRVHILLASRELLQAQFMAAKTLLLLKQSSTFKGTIQGFTDSYGRVTIRMIMATMKLSWTKRRRGRFWPI